MPTYAYRCGECGPFEVRRPMARSAEPAACPGCGTSARRLITAPALSQVPTGLARALGAAEQSADAPRVVGAVPPRRGRSNLSTDPRHAALPRP